MKTQITHLKLARYPELLTGPLRPIHWDVDPSTVCDHRCYGCPYIYDGADEGAADPMLGVIRPETAPDKRAFLQIEQFDLFLRDAGQHGCRAITFVGGGEPTMHPYFGDMMRMVDSSGMKFGVITHLGRKYDNHFFDALRLATWVRVSVNAATRQTYEQHQGKDHFDQAMGNLHRLATSGTSARVGMSFLVTKDNHHEIVAAARLAKTAGAHYIQYKPIIETPNLGASCDGAINEIGQALNEARALADDSFQVLGQWGSRLAELMEHTAGMFKGPCHVQRFNPKLGANGHVYTCCELAYSSGAADLGSIYDEPLSAILERAATTAIDMAGCPHCWDKRVNTLINENRLGEVAPPPESPDQEFV